MNLEDLHCFEGFVRPSGGSSKKAWLFALIAAAAGSVQIAPCLFARRSRPQLRSKKWFRSDFPSNGSMQPARGLGHEHPGPHRRSGRPPRTQLPSGRGGWVCASSAAAELRRNDEAAGAWNESHEAQQVLPKGGKERITRVWQSCTSTANEIRIPGRSCRSGLLTPRTGRHRRPRPVQSGGQSPGADL